MEKIEEEIEKYKPTLGATYKIGDNAIGQCYCGYTFLVITAVKNEIHETIALTKDWKTFSPLDWAYNVKHEKYTHIPTYQWNSIKDAFSKMSSLMLDTIAQTNKNM